MSVRGLAAAVIAMSTAAAPASLIQAACSGLIPAPMRALASGPENPKHRADVAANIMPTRLARGMALLLSAVLRCLLLATPSYTF